MRSLKEEAVCKVDHLNINQDMQVNLNQVYRIRKKRH